MELRMSLKEADLFRCFLSSSRSYFEYGVGGSTVLASKTVAGPVYAIDSDPDWLNKCRQEIEPSEYERLLIHVDIGPTKEWGYPSIEGNSEAFQKYHAAITDKSSEIELCLVDGRFRIACFLQAIKHLKADSIVAMHDYRSRLNFHVVERYARPIAEAEDLTFFVRRAECDFLDLNKTLDAHRCNAS